MWVLNGVGRTDVLVDGLFGVASGVVFCFLCADGCVLDEYGSGSLIGGGRVYVVFIAGVGALGRLLLKPCLRRV